MVVRVGDATMIGSIATLATSTKEGRSTLEVCYACMQHCLLSPKGDDNDGK